MAGYKKVILTERSNSLTATTTKDVESMSATTSQLDKFDTSYSSDKLNSIYNEYESIVINPEKNTLTKKDAYVQVVAKPELSFKTKVYIASATIVVALLIFLAVFNIFVINNMTSSIQLVEGNIVQEEVRLSDVIKDYNKLNNIAKWEEELRENGYDIDAIVSEKLNLIIPKDAGDDSFDTNWFDQICDFVSQLFGG